MNMEFAAQTVRDMYGLAARLASGLTPGLVIFLRGELGAGKTTFVAGVLWALGHEGTVKSPTFTLVEPYGLSKFPVYHFDLYRLNEPDELEFLGLRDYLKGESVCFFEWPERGAGILPTPDIDIVITRINDMRNVKVESRTKIGEGVLHGMSKTPA